MKVLPLGFALAAMASSANAQDALRSSSLAQGKALYDARCGICHAAGGIGTFMLAKRLGPENSLLASRTDIPVELVEQVVRNGINSMPAFTRVELTDAELKRIAAYLTRSRAR